MRDLQDPYVVCVYRFFKNFSHKVDILNGCCVGKMDEPNQRFMQMEDFQCNVVGRPVFDVINFVTMAYESAELSRDHPEYRSDDDMICMIEYVKRFCDLREFTINKKPVTFYNKKLKKVNGEVVDVV